MTLPATPTVVSAADVRADLAVNGTTGRYSDGAIGSNITASWEFLERTTQRWFRDRPAVSLTLTTNGNASVTIPGFRSLTSAAQQGTTLVADSTYWLVPDTQQTGLFTAIQLRGFGSRSDGPWYLGNPEWFDRNLDNQRYGFRYSLPNDLVLAGDGGYLDADMPFAVRLAVRVLAAWYTKRPDALLANVAITPEGNVLNYADLPPEVSEFISAWRLSGPSVVSVGS